MGIQNVGSGKGGLCQYFSLILSISPRQSHYLPFGSWEVIPGSTDWCLPAQPPKTSRCTIWVVDAASLSCGYSSPPENVVGALYPTQDFPILCPCSKLVEILVPQLLTEGGWGRESAARLQEPSLCTKGCLPPVEPWGSLQLSPQFPQTDFWFLSVKPATSLYQSI